MCCGSPPPQQYTGKLCWLPGSASSVSCQVFALGSAVWDSPPAAPTPTPHRSVSQQWHPGPCRQWCGVSGLSQLPECQPLLCKAGRGVTWPPPRAGRGLARPGEQWGAGAGHVMDVRKSLCQVSGCWAVAPYGPDEAERAVLGPPEDPQELHSPSSIRLVGSMRTSLRSPSG